MKKAICILFLLLFFLICCTSTKHDVRNRAFVPSPIPINLKCYCYLDDLHFNIKDSVFFNYYYKNVPLKDWREFEIIDLVAGILSLRRYTTPASERFRGINRKVSRLFLDEVVENPNHRITLEYYLNNKRIDTQADAFKIATLNEIVDDVHIYISQLRDTCKVNIIYSQER